MLISKRREELKHYDAQERRLKTMKAGGKSTKQAVSKEGVFIIQTVSERGRWLVFYKTLWKAPASLECIYFIQY